MRREARLERVYELGYKQLQIKCLDPCRLQAEPEASALAALTWRPRHTITSPQPLPPGRHWELLPQGAEVMPIALLGGSLGPPRQCLPHFSRAVSGSEVFSRFSQHTEAMLLGRQKTHTLEMKGKKNKRLLVDCTDEMGRLIYRLSSP